MVTQDWNSICVAFRVVHGGVSASSTLFSLPIRCQVGLLVTNAMSFFVSSLAYCEIYITLAHLLRRYDLELYQTTQEDMEWKDSFAPMTKGPLRVLLKKAEE